MGRLSHTTGQQQTTTRTRKKNGLTEMERETKGKENRERLRTSGLTRSCPLTRLEAKS